MIQIGIYLITNDPQSFPVFSELLSFS